MYYDGDDLIWSLACGGCPWLDKEALLYLLTNMITCHYGPWYPSLEIRCDTMRMYGEKVEHTLRLRRCLVNKDKVDF